jgi:arginine N-succinyltransferase
MLVVRPAGPGDIDALMELAALSGRGFTSLPEDEATLAARLALSAESFAGAGEPTAAWYTLMLEDGETGRIEGVSAVRAAVGVQRPHFSFRVMTLAQYSAGIDTRFDHQVLVLANECSGWTEVGSLYLRPERRSGGAGSLLARSRYLLINTDPDRFSDIVMAELRGWFDSDGCCPFWEGVASKFYRLPFDKADQMVMSTDGQFILDLAPRHPIYVELLSAEVRATIGRVHVEGESAMAMLRREGFSPSGLIDIFDGGPTVTCNRAAIDTMRRAVRLSVRIGAPADGRPALVSTNRLQDFRAVAAPVAVQDDTVVLDPITAETLRVAEGAVVQVR